MQIGDRLSINRVDYQAISDYLSIRNWWYRLIIDGNGSMDTSAASQIRRSFFDGGSNPTQGDNLIGRKMIDNMMIQVSKLSQKSENKSQKLRIEKSRKKDRK